MAAAAGGAESSVGSVYCVVYRLVALEWQVTGAGWSQVQVFRDSGDGSHRLVGWTVEDGLLTINSNITADCHYKRKSDDFHKMTDEEGQQWGHTLQRTDSSPRLERPPWTRHLTVRWLTRCAVRLCMAQALASTRRLSRSEKPSSQLRFSTCTQLNLCTGRSPRADRARQLPCAVSAVAL